jgi:hypothetical protein
VTDKTTRPSKAESARINGAKSSGPATPEGKANSANGNLRHGAYSKRVVMDGENPQFYESFKQSFFQHFLPEGPFECECVDAMVTARWRIRRIESAETCQLNHALLENKPANCEKFEQLDIVHERSIAVDGRIGAIDAFTRVQERLHRIYERNFKLLANSRRISGRSLPQQATCTTEPAAPQMDPPNEPNPISPELTNQPTETLPCESPVSSSIIQTVLSLVIFAVLLSPQSIQATLPWNPPIISVSRSYQTHKGSIQ